MPSLVCGRHIDHHPYIFAHSPLHTILQNIWCISLIFFEFESDFESDTKFLSVIFISNLRLVKIKQIYNKTKQKCLSQ